MAGSSPLARGLLDLQPRPGIIERIIPARAGFTASVRTRRLSDGDHPRSRGVYKCGGITIVRRGGSSPLARGLRQGLRVLLKAVRIIPARAGFTDLFAGRAEPLKDHPRSRGVYWRVQRARYARQGSSPLARGLQDDRSDLSLGPRIIPARAGFTASLPPGRHPRTDHPRSRGVYSYRARCAPVRCGSSPLARGLPGAAMSEHLAERIIPARAGFTPRVPGWFACRTDHPRSRGVYRAKDTYSRYSAGSSPLARGLLKPGCVGGDNLGIIPARAGFTSEVGSVSTSERDHPRSRGVYCGQQFRPHGLLGSSPLARGLR